VEFEDQKPFGLVEFAENPEPRCPCVLVLDNSTSMSGRPIAELNDGLQAFKAELSQDPMTLKRVELAIMSFGPVRTPVPFGTVDTVTLPVLVASGDTPMGAAIKSAVTMVQARKAMYRENGISYFRPWIFLITDGAPTDDWAEAARLVQQGEENKSFAFFAVGVEGADMRVLKEIAVRQPVQLKGLQFAQLFSWLSNSLNSVSRSRLNDEVTLSDPTGPSGWATV